MGGWIARARGCASVGVGLLLGCVRSSPSTQVLWAVPAGYSDESLAGPGEWLRLPAADGQAAPWRSPEYSELAYQADPGEVLAEGESFALVRKWGQVYAVGTKVGVTGPLLLPADSIWTGVLGRQVLSASADGTLRSLGSPEQAVHGERRVIGLVPGATSWDASSSVIAAAGDKVFVSRSGSPPYSATSPAPGQDVTQVAIRHDGVAVAVTRSASGLLSAWVSRNSAITWSPSAFAAPVLARRGSWIYSGPLDCPVVLSRDGLQWRDDLVRPPISNMQWEAFAMVVGDRPGLHALPATVTPSSPPAPPPGSPATAVSGLRICDREVSQSSTSPVLADECPPGPLGCLRATAGLPPRPGRVTLRWFSDGWCAAAQADLSGDGCHAGARPVLGPSVAVIDNLRLEVTTARIPAGCQVTSQSALLAAGGITLLLCGEGPLHRLFTAGEDAVWHPEAMVTTVSESLGLGQSADGTLVVSGVCLGDKPCGGTPYMLRKPVALGEERAWFELEGSQAVAYRALDGGRALAILSEPGSDETFGLAVVTPGEPDRKLISGINPAGGVRKLEVVQNVVAVLRTSDDGQREERTIITTTGRLDRIRVEER